MQAFADAVLRRDVPAMAALLAEDVEFRSPVVFRPYHGKATVTHILGAVVEVFGAFRYVQRYADGEGGYALVFETEVDGRFVEGCDFLTTDADGLITGFTVMIRPMSAAKALSAALARRLDADAAPRSAELPDSPSS